MTKSYELLIVDDEPIIRRGLHKLIERSERPIGTVRLASSGEEALRMIEERQPDFLFTDIRMSDMDGIELCRQIQERQLPILVAVISGYGEFQYAQKCVSYGVKEYLLKPVNQQQLEHVLDKLIASAAATRPAPGALLSIRECEAYSKRIFEAIWHISDKRTAAELDEWTAYTKTLGLAHPQLVQLLEDSLIAIGKLLSAKSISVLQEEAIIRKLGETQQSDQAISVFNNALLEALHELQRKRKGNTIDPIEAAKAYIDSHLNQEVSLEEVADYLGLNPSYFSQLFKQSTQETFVHYRMRKRMEQSVRLLEQAHYRIGDIALEVGYIDYSHFAKTFKKYAGMSPTEYRAKLGID